MTGSSIDAAWQHAWQRMLQSYKPEQLAIIESARSMSDVLAHLDHFQERQKERSSFRRLKKVKPVLDGLKRFDEVLKIYSGSYSAAALIWGSIKLIIELLSSSLSYFDRLITVWRNIDQNLPRMEHYVELFSQNEKLSSILSLVYTDIMDFCILATNTLTRKKWLLWKKASLIFNFETRANEILANIRGHGQLMDAEANSCNIRHAEQARLDQILTTKVFQSLEVVKWLNPADSEYYFECVNRYREAGTGDWFLCSEKVIAWTNGVRPFLWVKGIPRCGKTVLCSCLIDHFKTNPAENRVAFFFCDGTSQNKKSSAAILRSVIAQLVAADASLTQIAFKWVTKSGQERATSYNSLLALCKEILINTGEVYLILDALDECEDGKQTQILKNILSINGVREIPLRICIFSRDETWIQKEVKEWPVLEITSDSIQHDVTLYVKRSLQQPPLSMIRDTKLARKIVETLSTKADGQFLWVKLMIQSLQKSTFISEINKTLENLPRGLGQVYARVLEKLLGEARPRQKAGHMLLQWLVCSEKPLTMNELSTALAIRPGATTIEEGDRVVDLPSFLEELCGSLVRINHPRDGKEDVTISLVHLTVKEYLLSSEELFGPDASVISRFRVEVSAGNKYITSICLTYLTLDVFKAGARSDTAMKDLLPFLHYASLFWATHLALSGRPDPELLRLLKLFFQFEHLTTHTDISTKEIDRRTTLVAQNQGYLNTWIRQCDPKDPRLAQVLDFFKTELSKTWQLRIDTLGPDHEDTLEAGHQLAFFLHNRGEWQLAEPVYTDVMHSRSKVLGQNDIQTLETVFQLANLKNNMGRYEEAQNLQEQCLQGRREVYGFDSPETLLCEDWLARIFKEQGRLDESERLSRATLIKKVRTLGDEKLETIRTMDNLAAILKDVGLAHRKSGNEVMALEAFWECESLSRKCFSMRGNALGVNNAETVTCLNMLGLVLRHLHRPDESEACHRQALATREKLFGSHNIHTQRSMRNLIAVLKDQGKMQEAEELSYRLSQSQQIDTTLVDREKITQYHGCSSQ